MKRFLYRTYKIFNSFKNKLLKRLTGGGLLVVTGLAVSAVFGLDTNLTMAYQVFTFLFALFLVAILYSFFFSLKLGFQRNLPKFGTAGEPLSYRIQVKNLTNKLQKDLSILENVPSSTPDFEHFANASEPLEKKRNPIDRSLGYHRWLYLLRRDSMVKMKSLSLPDIPPNGEIEIKNEIVPLKRGILRLEGITAAKTDPFGLVRSYKKVNGAGAITILPRRYRVPLVDLSGNRHYQPGGVALAGSVGDSEEFISMRDYRPGDPLRRIHWKSWAKTGKPIVKEYQDEFFVRHALVLDAFYSPVAEELFEDAVSVAASYAYSVLTQESLLDLMFIGAEAYCFTSGRGLSHIDKMMEILASVQMCHDKPFSELPPLVLRRAPLLSACIIVLLAWDEERRNFIARLKTLNIPLKVVVIGEEGSAGPENGPLAGDPENFHWLQKGNIEAWMTRQ